MYICMFSLNVYFKEILKKKKNIVNDNNIITVESRPLNVHWKGEFELLKALGGGGAWERFLSSIHRLLPLL